MSRFEHIFLRTGLPVDEAARQLATLPGMELVDDDGKPFVRRETRYGGHQVGGPVSANSHADPSLATVLNAYDTMYGIWSSASDEDAQRAEAERIFGEIIERLKWPAALVFGLDSLAAAWSPELGVTYFPPRTTPDEPYRALWQPYERS
jgi:hypothetical protein